VSNKNKYNPMDVSEDFNPSKAIKSRYATKVVNPNFYGKINIGEVQPWKVIAEAKKGPITQVVMDNASYEFAIRNYDHYKDRNPWMAHNYLRAMLEYMEREIRRKHCEQ